MNCLEFSLQVLVALNGVSHLVIDHEFIRDLERNQELGSVRLSVEVWKTRKEPVEDVMANLLLTMHDVSAVVRVEVAGVAQNFQESADALLGLLASFLLHVDRRVLLIKVSEDLVDQLEKLEWRLVIKLDHAQVLHERRSVETVDDDLDLCSIKIGRFVEYFCSIASIHIVSSA